jgi:hypothetical protein
MSHPGAGVNDITKLLPNVLHQDMDIDSIVVHVSFNDIMKGSSEQLKLDFKELIDSLLDTNKRPIISGPVSSLNRGIKRFSRILSLHNWQRDYCSTMGVNNTFYKEDGIHPNRLDSWILSQIKSNQMYLYSPSYIN